LADTKTAVEKTGGVGSKTSSSPARKNAAATSTAKSAVENQKPEATLPPLEVGAQTPSELWDDYFQKRKPARRVVQQLVLRLHESRKHEHVIALIQAALKQGQAQPWMYDVLAASMQLTGRPKSEIDRVLLSQIDFTAADVPNMILSAAYLARFGRNAQALHLYRQSSRLNPERPEPYALGLRLAIELKDQDGIAWAACGTLAHVWTKDWERQHRAAEDAIAELEQELRKANKVSEAENLQKRVAAARTRDLKLRLDWSGEGDLDLIIEEPGGSVCSSSDPITAGGGVLLNDGAGPNPKNCHEDYVCSLAFPGMYRVRIRAVVGNIVGKRAILTVIRAQGTGQESVERIGVLVSKDDTVVRIALPRGRRSTRHEVQESLDTSDHRIRRNPGNVRFMVGEMDAGQTRAARRFQRARQQRNVGVGYQPVTTVLSEGSTMSAAAVISADRRYVRITTVPTISSITDVFTFSFLNGGN